jgi:glycosyltransferase involved in cell wall biosynthesis
MDGSVLKMSMNQSSGPADFRVLIVAEHASLKFGGEAALPLHYYRIYRQRNMAAWLVVHERTRSELDALFPQDNDRIVFITDTAAHLILWKLSRFFPAQLFNLTIGYALRYMTQFTQRKVIRRLIADEKISVIHQPMPVSPKEPSMIYDMGVPVIIGPMNGGMDYPPAFRKAQRLSDRVALGIGRRLANMMNRLIPGKRKAAALLVANERTRAALPSGACSRVITLVENGVDLNLWKNPVALSKGSTSTIARFVFVGRLVDWKAVDLLLLAFKQASAQAPMSLSIIGDGNERPRLEQMARNLELLGESVHHQGRVLFLGWMSQADCAAQLQQCDALVLPSLAECGGAVVLEAMAMKIPVIAAAWGGPADYLDPSCGILVEPTSREAFINNFARALTNLSKNPQLRAAMGESGRRKIVECFDWEAKADRMVEIYREAIAAFRSESDDRVAALTPNKTSAP